MRCGIEVRGIWSEKAVKESGWAVLVQGHAPQRDQETEPLGGDDLALLKSSREQGGWADS